jgi:hypothetical protein
MKAHHILCGWVLSAGVAGLCGSAFGQTTPRPESPMVAARKQVTEATTAVTTAKQAVLVARQKVVVAFKAATPDYTKAEQDATKAKQEMDAAKAAAQTAVRSKPEYKQAAASKAALQEKLRGLQDAKPGDPERTAITTEFTQTATNLNHMETQGVDSDPKYTDAKARYLEATKALESFKTQVDEACKADPEYMAADQALQTAQQALVQVTDAMKATQKAEAEARNAESKARSEANKAKSK